MKYIMELTDDQYLHIANCVETCHRIACGQIGSICEILPIKPDEAVLSELKRQAFPELSRDESYCWEGGYRGNQCGEDFRKSFDTFQARGYQIYRQMRYVRNMALGIDNVLSSPTLTTSKADQPVIKWVDK